MLSILCFCENYEVGPVAKFCPLEEIAVETEIKSVRGSGGQKNLPVLPAQAAVTDPPMMQISPQ
ncbi:MAG: hypothetical protein R3B84_15165 [Zavarzinella sp.]